MIPLRSYITILVTITKQRGVPCPCHQAPRPCLKRLPDAWSEEPSDLFPVGYLGAVPRSMRGYRTVNLEQRERLYYIIIEASHY